MSHEILSQTERHKALSTQLDGALRHLWTVEGQLSELRAREAELRLDVGQARGFLEHREEYEEALDSLQRDTNGTLLSKYGQILSRLACEVLEQDITIDLTLNTERGLPALGIVARGPNNAEIDIVEGMGGSLTNTICLGLRLIAAARIPGMRKFMFLDEVDCWVRPGRIARFYDVVKQLAAHGGIQTVVIAHHDVGQFSQDTNILQLRGRPRGGLHVEASGAGGWSDNAQPGIRSIRLVNVAGYIDSTMNLSPGVNAILGENNIGKSQAIRALRAVFYGVADDGLIRFGENRCEVHVTFENGVLLSWSREPGRRTSVNEWTLRDASGEVMTIDGAICQAGKRKKGAGQDSRGVPDWVRKVSGVFMYDDLDIQMTHQKKPLFLLDRPATQRAEILHIGRESAYCAAMVALHKKNCQEKTQLVTRGEKELGTLLPRIEHLQNLVNQSSEILAAQKENLQAIADANQSLSALSAATERFTLCQTATLALSRRQQAYASLPDIAALQHLQTDMKNVETMRQNVERSASLTRDVASLQNNTLALAGLPAIPQFESTQDLLVATQTLSTLSNDVADLEKKNRIFAEIPKIPVLVDLTEMKADIKKERSLDLDVTSLKANLTTFDLLPTLPALESAHRKIPQDLHALAEIERGRGVVEEALADVTLRSEAVQGEMRGLLEGLGFSCPLCGSHLPHEHPLVKGIAA